MMDVISPLEINKNLQKDIEILYFEEIDSTNNYIKRNTFANNTFGYYRKPIFITLNYYNII